MLFKNLKYYSYFLDENNDTHNDVTDNLESTQIDLETVLDKKGSLAGYLPDNVICLDIDIGKNKINDLWKITLTKIKKIIDNKGIRYGGLDTDHGAHIMFKKPIRKLNDKFGANVCALGIKQIEYKHSKHKMTFIKNGIFRNGLVSPKNTEFMDVEELDTLPLFLFPVTNVPENFIGLDEIVDERNNNMYRFAKILNDDRSFLPLEIKNIMFEINNNILFEPLPEKELIHTLDSAITHKTNINDFSTYSGTNCSNLSGGQLKNKFITEFVSIVTEREDLVSVKINNYERSGARNIYFLDENKKYCLYDTSNEVEKNAIFVKGLYKYKCEQMPVSFYNDIDTRLINEINVKHQGENRGISLDNSLVQFDNGVFSLETKTFNDFQVGCIPRKTLFFNYIPLENISDEDKLFVDTLFNDYFYDGTNYEQRKSFDEFFGTVLFDDFCSLKKGLLLFGETNTGKSILIKIINLFLDRTLVSTLASSALFIPGKAPSPELCNLANKLLNIDSDMSDRKGNSDICSFLKTVIGPSEPLTIRNLYRGMQCVQINCKFMFVTNKLPTLLSYDKAIAERFIIITCDNRNKSLGNQLKTKTRDIDEYILKTISKDSCKSYLFHIFLDAYERLIGVNDRIFSSSEKSDSLTKTGRSKDDSFDDGLYEAFSTDSEREIAARIVEDKTTMAMLYQGYLTRCRAAKIKKNDVLMMNDFTTIFGYRFHKFLKVIDGFIEKL